MNAGTCHQCGVDVPGIKDESISTLCDECREKRRVKSSELYKIIKQAEVLDTGWTEALRG